MENLDQLRTNALIAALVQQRDVALAQAANAQADLAVANARLKDAETPKPPINKIVLPETAPVPAVKQPGKIKK